MALKLISLALENYKRVSLAKIVLDPDAAGIVALMGPNESGKTSTLDAFAALVSGRAAPKRRKPVKDGATTATIIGEFIDPDGVKLVVTRTYTDGGGTSIKVEQDGIKVAKPDEILRRLYSHIALDPLAFANSPSKEQADTLIRLIGFDPAPLDRRIDDAFATRTDVNRDVKRLDAELTSYPAEDAALAARGPVSVADLTEQIDAVILRNRNREDCRLNILTDEHEIGRQRNIIAEAERRIRELEQHGSGLRTELSRLGSTDEDPEPIREQIRTAEATNDAIRQQQARARKAAELAETRDRVANLEGIMQAARDEKAAQFAEAEWPVDGLDIVDGEVYLEGTPFAETSAGRKLRTSTAIAMALNPDLRAIVIRDGSLLDKTNRQMIDDIAQEHGFTVLMEIVDESAESGVVFSEGEIVGRKGGVS